MLPVSTVASPVNSCHSPLTAACICHAFTGPTPRQVSLFAQLGHAGGRQSAVVSHARGGACSGEHVFGATGVASWRALLTSSASTVTRTCVRGLLSLNQPA